jgi:hypothetical protein
MHGVIKAFPCQKRESVHQISHLHTVKNKSCKISFFVLK